MGISIIRCDTCDEWKATRKFRITGTVGGAFDFASICIECEDPLNADIYDLERDALIAEVKKLRKGIRDHRDSNSHDLCWWVPELWSLLPEKVTPKPCPPPEEEFLVACRRYRKSLD